MANTNNSTVQKKSQNSQAKRKAQTTTKFKWSEEMVQDLLDGLLEYKTQMEFNNSDFNADKSKQYESVRVILASKYAEDTTLFGPKDIKPIQDGEDRDEYLKRQEDDKLKIRKGYLGVLEKIKALRQKFSTAVTTGRRSGSGKMVMEFYDLMVLIWGGAPSTEPLSFGAHSAGQAEESQGGVDISCNSGLENQDNEYDSDNSLITSNSLGNNVANTSSSNNVNEATTCKRLASNPVPVLIDNKRKHMERQLSAAQRDKLLMQESKEEKEFRKELSNSLKESNNIFAESMKAMSTSMMALVSSMEKSFEHSASPQYINHMAPTHISGHIQPMPNVIQQGNYIYSPATQFASMAPHRNTSDDDDCEQQTFCKL